MELHSILAQDKGFTIIEVIIAIGILAIILSLGLFVSFDFYKSYSFASEKNIIVSVLQKARSQSLNNIDQVGHGVHFESGKYIIFECEGATPNCASYADADTSQDIEILASYAILIKSPTPPFDVIFDQLSGASSNITITVSDGAKDYDIIVNSEGQIDWQ